RYWCEPQLPWRRRRAVRQGDSGSGGSTTDAVQPPVVTGRGVVAWIDKYGSGYEPLSWQPPSPAHLSAASSLLHSQLLGAVRRVKQAAAGAAGGSSGGSRGGPSASSSSGSWDAATKLLVRGELLKINGLLVGTLSLLRDFGFGG
ncbi:hypothetical protein Agub_g5524, partial [Astrephomene gubernaculifera]